MNIQMVYEIKKSDLKFPETFKTIGEDSPEVIYCSGNLSLLKKTGMVAIIGARAVDQTGIELAYKLGVRYSSNVVISGLAKGSIQLLTMVALTLTLPPSLS